MRRLVMLRLRLDKGQKGFTLIETLIGAAIFVAIGLALMSGLSTGHKNLGISQERTYAEGLAKSQVEYIKAQEYISVGNYGTANQYTIVDIPEHLADVGYSVEINPPETVDVAGVSGHELQSIIITVKHQGSEVLTITVYRVGLAL